ncbi:MAG: SDR family NAD(P)-dependent oxidoreductase [Phycisphaerae bacterium]|nr:SDR family NAD(P)-dependent oxidoreductase [Phycisphaerae bacterium]
MRVVITGASAGIGKALAIELSRAGATLVLAARRLDRLQALNESLGGGHLCVRTDVSDESQCRALIDRAAAEGRIDTLVCNAGYGMIRTIAETSSRDMRRIFATNVFGTTDCIKAAVPVMERQSLMDGYRGQVMIVSSAAARRGLPFFGAYSATKFAQLGIAEALRIELCPAQIAVTSVHPIGTDTDFFTTAEQNASIKLPPPGMLHTRQCTAMVARKMAEAIRRPRPELWPMGLSRWGLGLSALVPRLTDYFVLKFSRNLLAQQPSACEPIRDASVREPVSVH